MNRFDVPDKNFECFRCGRKGDEIHPSEYSGRCGVTGVTAIASDRDSPTEVCFIQRQPLYPYGICVMVHLSSLEVFLSAAKRELGFGGE